MSEESDTAEENGPGFDLGVQEADKTSEYRVLARKYRPSSFADLIGQEPMVRTLRNAFSTGRIAQAYMLTGVRGVGKTTTARILARALNYESDTQKQPTLDLSTPGIHCADIMEGNHVDVIEMDAASHTGIGDIREIIAAVRYKPVSARYKVYIIDEVHMLSTAAFNGLLKTLEEPPEHVKFIFATTEIRKVPITILSRCQRFDLRRIEAGEMVDHLGKIAKLESIAVEDEALAMIARASEGSVRDALSVLDQAIAHASAESDATVRAEGVRDMLGLADRARVIDLFEFCMKGDIAAALAEMKAQHDVGADPATVLTDLADFVHFVTRVRYVDTALDDPSLSQQQKTRGKDFAERLTPRILGRAWQMLLKGIAEVQSAPRPLAAADMVLVRLTHAADLPTPDEALRQLADGGSAPSGGAGGGAAPSGGGGGAMAIAAGSGRNAPTAGPTVSAAPRPQLVVENETVAEAEPVKRPAPQLVPQADPEPVAPPVAAPAYDNVESLKDMLDLAEAKRDIRFKMQLRNNFSEVSFAPGHIVFRPTGNAPKDLARTITDRLLDWTGTRWTVETTHEGGSETISDQESAEHDRTMADAEAHPVVAAVLKAFPRSKITQVRFPKLEAEKAATILPDEPFKPEAITVDERLDNPDDEMDDDAGPALDHDDPGAGGLDDYFNS
ncbi:DNA polymerase III subunit gamma/tau [Ahrensia sp. R2A130]|uniref:DNA polymerase III subunit gamma/tau n=1 Tax=Ahrensia sp. R2A130 TaxID=744979 RepID=UPI0001E0E06F|nr:DNA polymerase III subunit gamma/tau [Ahrensia sp. R2A130]EFL89805.1 DNA polymerase III subunit tau [Ahrensia sp. R2A130]